MIEAELKARVSRPQALARQLETMARDEELEVALAAVRDTLASLGVGEEELTTEQCTDAVMRARAAEAGT